MKISELITNLEYLKYKFGDMNIFYQENHEKDESGELKIYDILLAMKNDKHGNIKFLITPINDKPK